MLNLAKETLTLLGCTAKMKDEIESLNYPRRDAKFQERMRTFRDVQLPVPAAEFALAGFVYTGPGDRVMCTYCQGKLEDWSKGDNPLAEHCRHYESCSFLAPLITKPKSSKYARYQDRLKTFKKWGNRYPCPDDLAAAGFTHVKDRNTDLVQCFACHVCLHSWSTSDEPWAEHAKWSPNCPHLIRVRGYDFVLEVKANKFTSKLPKVDMTKMTNILDTEEIPLVDSSQSKKEIEQFCTDVLTNISCKICYSNRANVVLLECLHLAICSACCCSDLKACPVCRTNINNNAVRVFLP